MLGPLIKKFLPAPKWTTSQSLGNNGGLKSCYNCMAWMAQLKLRPTPSLAQEGGKCPNLLCPSLSGQANGSSR